MYALIHGNTFQALIRGIQSNQDGATAGITQPKKDMQTQLIRNTYAKANLDLGVTRFFEAHGTGTPVGDPIEAKAIGESFQRSSENPLYVSAVKSNIGHLGGTSGLAGIVKAILAIEKSSIPPNTNFEILNPEIDAERFGLKLPDKPVNWSDEVRRASINSFGYGGYNAHCFLDDVHSFMYSSQMKKSLLSQHLPSSHSNGVGCETTNKHSLGGGYPEAATIVPENKH
jgi:acyl transferase domain-containing protein